MRLGRALPVLAAWTALGTGACFTRWEGGINAVVEREDATGRLVLRSVTSGGAADAAGLAPGDEVVAIDGTPAARLSEDDVRTRVIGEVGSRLRLSVRRGAAAREVELVRAPR